jgi:hypothetical protein
MIEQEEHCLVVILEEPLKLAEASHWPIAGLVIDDKYYRDCGFGDFTEFYDWLRNSLGEVVGVRYYLAGDTEFLFEYGERKTYMVASDRGTFKYIEIYFSDIRDVDPLLSGDQGFLYDPVFRSDDGHIAIAFDMDWLSEAELAGLRQNSQIFWANVKSIPRVTRDSAEL